MKLTALIALLTLAAPSVAPALLPAAPRAQFTAAELAERARWETFLHEARLVSREQFGDDLGVTNPWKLCLEKDGVTRFALWKNPSGTQRGFLEGWRYEIAAYELDKLLGIGMVPPTVEKRFRGQLGSCQLWIDDTMLLRGKLTGGEADEAYRTPAWKRMGYIAQVFDNLIGNEDRHMGNVLVTADDRCILIDHSRTFRTAKAFTEGIPFTESKLGEGEVMRELPRALVDKVRSLTEAEVMAAVGKNLTSRELKAVMARRVLLLAEIDRIIARYGEGSVLY